MDRTRRDAEGLRQQSVAVRRWADHGRAAWLLGEGVSAALGAVVSGGVDGAELIARLEALIERSWLLEGPGEAKERAVVRPVDHRAKGSGVTGRRSPIAAVWRDGDRALGDLRLETLFIGAATVRGVWTAAAVGLVDDGTKRVLGLWRGSTADAVVAREITEGLTGRGLDRSRGLLVVHDGSQVLDAAVRRAWGGGVLLAHCPQSVCDAVLGHLPEKARPQLKRVLREATAATGPERERKLAAAVKDLVGPHPGAAERLRRSVDALCTVDGLGVPSPLRQHVEGIGPVRWLADAANRAKVPATGPAAVAAVLPTVLAGMRRIIGYEAMPLLAERLAARAAAIR